MSVSEILSPREKKNIKLLAHWVYRVINLKRKVCSKKQVICFRKKNAHTFFGYYDVSPFNSNNQLLYLELNGNHAYADIVLNNIDNTGKMYIGKTYAWNWQQGCRLRWLPGSDTEVIFNIYEDNNYGAQIISTDGSLIRKLKYPLYDIDPTGKYGLTLNFERLGFLRPGYGYTCRKYEENDLENESIQIIDLTLDKIIDKITYRQIAEKMIKECCLKKYYINHLSFSPDGTKFLFFWIEIVNTYHKASLMVYDIETKTIIPLETEEKVSHYVWLNNDEILCTSYKTPNKCRYYIYCISKQSKISYCPMSLKEDGHPSIYKDGYVITDTYPDKNGYQNIYLVDQKKDSKVQLIQIYSRPVMEGEKRTDLHPRLNQNKTLVCFDSNKNSKRELYILKLNYDKNSDSYNCI